MIYLVMVMKLVYTAHLEICPDRFDHARQVNK